MPKQKGGYRRGYPVAILLGLENNRAVLWRVFSSVVKPGNTIRFDGTRSDPKATYNFHESIVNALRPMLKEGIRSVILASPLRTDYAHRFVDHIRSHHVWLVQGANKATFSDLTGSASTLSEVAALTRTPVFKRLINDTRSQETEDLIDMLEKRLGASDQNTVILYSLEEIEDLVFGVQQRGRPRPEYLMLTDKYLTASHERNRMNRLMQIATNKNVKTKIVDTRSIAGQRLTQLGGMVCIASRD